jgi:hypothetical protein
MLLLFFFINWCTYLESESTFDSFNFFLVKSIKNNNNDFLIFIFSCKIYFKIITLAPGLLHSEETGWSGKPQSGHPVTASWGRHCGGTPEAVGSHSDDYLRQTQHRPEAVFCGIAGSPPASRTASTSSGQVLILFNFISAKKF